ncbi:MAG: FKBP-type peptidyl-prolyl cis-trans isomerase [Candidatus Sumerlaeota bacterium]
MKTLYKQVALAAFLAGAVAVRAQDPTTAPPPAAAAADAGGNDAAKAGYVLGYKVSEQIKEGEPDIDLDAFMEGFKTGMKGEADVKKTSYAIGQQVSKQFREGGLELDNDEFAKGVNDCFKGTAPKFSADEQKMILDKMRTDSQQRQLAKNNIKKVENLEAAKKFLEENKTKDGVKTTASGLQYKVLSSGDAAGKSPSPEDIVKVNYKGTLIDGKEFDSSEKNGGPIEFPVGKVIKGWTEALQLMKPGDKWQLFIPPDIAYGEAGSPPKIEPNSALIFEVELLSFKAGVDNTAPPQ